jgi:hypothetical protein
LQDRFTIHIPFELARYAVWQRTLVTKYETNAVIKALDTWLVLKHETRSGYIQQWNKQKEHLLTICKISESVFRHRLKVLKQIGLIQYDRLTIRTCSWTELGNKLQIDTKQKFPILYDTTNAQRVQEWLIATEIKDNQCRQAYMIMKNLNHHPVIYNEVVKELVRSGAEESRLKDIEYFLSWMNIVYRNDFVRASAIHSILIDIRPDTNRSVRGMANAWKCKDPTNVSYWKKVLYRSRVIDISKMQIQSQERVRNTICKVLWLKKPKETLLCLCDNISVLTPWIVDPVFKALCKDNTNNKDSAIDTLSAA